MRGLALAAAVLLPLAGPALAQQDPGGAAPLQVSTAVLPETVTVGERFRSMVRVSVPPGYRVVFPELPVADSLQPTDSVRVVPGGAGESPLAAYSLVAWVAGVPLTARVAVRVTTAEGNRRTYVVPLRLPVVRSVLPRDTAGLRPRPARGVLALPVPPAARWPWLLAALALATAGWLLARRWRGRMVARPASSRREHALQALRALRAGGLLERGEWDALYAAATRVLREYIAACAPALGTELTSAELLRALNARAGGVEAAARLAPTLEHADRVKFAAQHPAPGEAERFLEQCLGWVERFDPGVADAPAEREAA